MRYSGGCLRDSSHLVGGGVFDSRFCTRTLLAAFLPGRSARTAMQMHYNETRGNSGTQVEEESTCSPSVPLGLLVPRSLEASRVLELTWVPRCCAFPLLNL